MAIMATTKRRSLGRGLGALLGQPEPDDESPVAAQPPADEELQKLPVDLLQRGKYQPRIDMRPETLQEDVEAGTDGRRHGRAGMSPRHVDRARGLRQRRRQAEQGRSSDDGQAHRGSLRKLDGNTITAPEQD